MIDKLKKRELQLKYGLTAYYVDFLIQSHSIKSIEDLEAIILKLNKNNKNFVNSQNLKSNQDRPIVNGPKSNLQNDTIVSTLNGNDKHLTSDFSKSNPFTKGNDLNDPNNKHVSLETRALNIFKYGYDHSTEPKIKSLYHSCMADIFVHYLGPENLKYAKQIYFDAIMELNLSSPDLTIFISTKFNVVNQMTGDIQALNKLQNQILDSEQFKKGNPDLDHSLKELFLSALEFVSSYNENIARQLCLLNLGELMEFYNDKKEAKAFFEQAFAIPASHRTIVFLSHKLSILSMDLKMWERAKEHLNFKLGFILMKKEEVKDSPDKTFIRQEPFVLIDLAVTYLNLGLIDDANNYYDQCNAFLDNKIDIVDKAHLLKAMGLFKLQANKFYDSKLLMDDSFELYDKMSYEKPSQQVLLYLIYLCSELKDLENFDKYCDLAIDSLNLLNDSFLEAQTIITIIRLNIHLNRLNKVREILLRYPNLTIKDSTLNAQFTLAMAIYSHRTNQSDKGLELFKGCIEISKIHNNKSLECDILGEMGESFIESGNFVEALKLTNEALMLAVQIEDKEKESKWTGNLGDISLKLGNINDAKKFYQMGFEIAQKTSFYLQNHWKSKINDLDVLNNPNEFKDSNNQNTIKFYPSSSKYDFFEHLFNNIYSEMVSGNDINWTSSQKDSNILGLVLVFNSIIMNTFLNRIGIGNNHLQSYKDEVIKNNIINKWLVKKDNYDNIKKLPKNQQLDVLLGIDGNSKGLINVDPTV